jgi:hypothetical protein
LLLTIGTEDAGHTNLFTNNTFHFFYSLCPVRLLRHSRR